MKLSDLPYLASHLLEAFMLGLTVLVMAVPEGLPMMIAVVLSANIKRMLRANVLVRKSVGIEAAGSMNILFTDKTGTLTEGKMSVAKIICPDGTEFADFTMLQNRAPELSRLYSVNCRCNTSSVVSGARAVGGNATDRALLESVIRQKEAFCDTLSKLPFDSSRKYSMATVRCGKTMTLIKGAPEKLLPHLKYAYTKNGESVPFSSFLYDTKCRVLSSQGSVYSSTVPFPHEGACSP